MKVCKRARIALEAHWAGELEVSERLWWEGHCELCSNCDRERVEQGAVVERLTVYREAPLHRVDVDAFHERLLEALPAGQAQLEARPAPVRGRRGPFAVAATVLILGTAGYLAVKAEPDSPAPEKTAEGRKPAQEAQRTASLEPQSPLFAPAIEEGDPLDRGQIETVLAELRDGILLERNDPQWTQQLLRLRKQGWPLANLFARIAREGDAVQAERAVIELAQIDTNTARLHLWKLRTSAPADAFAVTALMRSTPFPAERVARLYWESPQRQRVREGVGHVRGGAAIDLARRVLEYAPRNAMQSELTEDLAQWLAQAGDAGPSEAMAWWSDQRIPDDLWVQSLSDLGELWSAIESQLDAASSLQSQRRMLALAQELPGEEWTDWVTGQSYRRELHEQALAVLAVQPGMSALQSLWALRGEGVTDRELWLECWAQALASDPRRVMDAWDAVRWEGRESQVYAFAQSLLMGREFLEPVALATIGVHPDLSMDLVFEALAGIESVDSDASQILLEGLEQIPAEDTQRAAAIWVALSRAGGEVALEEGLGLAEGVQPTRAQVQLIERTQTNTPRSFRERCYLIERRLQRVRANRSVTHTE